MQINELTDNGFIISNNLYKVECNFSEMNAVLFKNGELESYCSLKFPHPWNASNLLKIINVGSNEMLFEVDLKGSDLNEWTNQLMKAFADYLKDDLIIGNYNISGYNIVKIL